MAKNKTPRVREEKSLIEVRVLVLTGASGSMIWLAIVRPTVATAIGLGLTVLYVMHRLVGR